MKYLKKFNENISIYDPKWEVFLPENIVIFKGQNQRIDRFSYKKGNIMLNSDMIQISYGINEWSVPNTFEIDIYFTKEDSGYQHQDQTTLIKGGVYNYNKIQSNQHNIKLNVDMTLGDGMASEFMISKTGVKVIQYTSYGSKYDPTNTIFAIEDESLKKIVHFFNRFDIGYNLSLEDFNFLRNKLITKLDISQ